MSAIDVIRRRLKEDRVPDIPDEFGEKVGDRKPDAYVPAQAWEEYFSEGGPPSVRHLGKGSRIRDKMNDEERSIIARERG